MSVVVDSREASAAKRIVRELVLRGLEVRVEPLEFGDYYVSGVLVERKTATDLVASLREGRLWSQLEGLKSSNALPMMILETSIKNIIRYTGFKEVHVAGVLSSIVLDWRIPVMFSHSSRFTATIISTLARRTKHEGLYPLRFKPRVESLRDTARFIVEGFPGLGPERAEQILKHFGSIRSFIVNAERADEVEGVGSKTKKKILEIIDYKYT
jgi:ERCC4-type nuclease